VSLRTKKEKLTNNFKKHDGSKNAEIGGEKETREKRRKKID
jgi:hypothetical protein